MTKKKLYCYKAKCSRVIDGDTIFCDWVDLGFYTLIKKQTFRFNRINTPECRTRNKTEKKKGLKAKEWLKNQVEGKEIIIETQKTDAFGRYLAEVWLNGENLNDKIVSLGLGKYQKY